MLLGLDFHSKKLYYSRFDISIYNPMFYLGIGRQEWVDVLGWVQMMTSYVIRQVLPIGSQFCCWAQFSIGRIIYYMGYMPLHTFGDLGNGG